MIEPWCVKKETAQNQWKEQFLTEIFLNENKKSTHFNVLTKEKYLELILEVEEAERAEKKTALQQRRLKRFAVLNTGNIKQLVARSDDSIRYYLLADECFDVIDAVHGAVGHGGRDKMLAETSVNYANVTKEMINLYLSMCETCQQKRTNKKRGNNSAQTTVKPPPDPDKELLATLGDIDKNNYLYLFERCKEFNINARQLKYLDRVHIWVLIPKTNLGVLAEFEYLLNEWKTRHGYNRPSDPLKDIISTCVVETPSVLHNDHSANGETLLVEKNSSCSAAGEESQSGFTSSTRQSTENIIDEPKCLQYPLDKIVPRAFKKYKQKYNTNSALISEVDRRKLSMAIIDYFLRTNKLITLQLMKNMASQIADYFTTENRFDWYDYQWGKGRGRLHLALQTALRNKNKKAKQVQQHSMDVVKEEISAADVPFVLNENSTDDEMLEESQQIRKWLKCNKYEDMDEVMNMWRTSKQYRKRQIRSLQSTSEESLKEFLNEWPSYKWPTGHMLLDIDFQYMFPRSETSFCERWPIFIHKIVNLMQTELKDDANVELLDQLQSADMLSEDSKHAIILNLLHHILKPSKYYSTPESFGRNSIADSQLSVMRSISHISFIENFVETLPCIFVVGANINSVDFCVLAYRDIRYELKVEDALRACLQIYMVFNLEFPFASTNFWKFICTYLFDIQTDEGFSSSSTSYNNVDSIVKYLAS